MRNKIVSADDAVALDLCVLPVNEFKTKSVRIESDHKEFRQISDSWAASLRTAFNALPDIKL